MLAKSFVTVICLVALTTFANADSKLSDAAKDAVDPDCDVKKAAKGAAMKATVGVGNRCGAAETARDVTGVDGKIEDTKDNIEDALPRGD